MIALVFTGLFFTLVVGLFAFATFQAGFWLFGIIEIITIVVYWVTAYQLQKAVKKEKRSDGTII